MNNRVLGKGKVVNQIFATKMLVHENLWKEKKLHAAFMNREKAHDRVDKAALWNTLRIYGVGGELMEEIKTFYWEANAYVKVDGKLSDSFAIGVGVRQLCVMSPWLFNIFMDRCMREMEA